ncbi:MAG: FlgO family outer membrane protein [Spirochaetota bacterium]
MRVPIHCISVFITGALLCTAAEKPRDRSMLAQGAEVLAQKIAQSFRREAKEKYKNNIAVFEFSVNGKSAKENGIGNAFTSVLITEIKKTGEFDVIDRANLDKAMKEMELGLSGAVDTATAAQLGKIVAANLLLNGTVSEVENNYIISVQMTEIESGRIILTEKVEFAKDKLNNAAKVLLSSRKYPITAGFQSALVPGWGQFYNDTPIQGTICFSAFVATVASAVTFKILAELSYAEYTDYKKWEDPTNMAYNRQHALDLYNNTVLYDNIALFSLIGYGVVWLYAVVDAIVIASIISDDLDNAAKNVSYYDYLHRPRFAIYPGVKPGDTSVHAQFSICF